jgi:hypothetical protein
MPTVYILKCKDNCYYIGKTTGSYFKDIDNHFKGNGCEWTQLHKPIRLELLRHFCEETDDDFYTRLFVTKYGIDKVRGGSYSQVKLSEQEQDEIYHYPIDTHLTCLKCYMQGHKRHLCPFLRNSFDKKDTIIDADDDDTTNICDNVSKKPILMQIINHIKGLVDKFYNNKLCNVMSMRFGRSGSFHKLNLFDHKDEYKN